MAKNIKHGTDIDLDQEEVYVDGKRFTNADAEAAADQAELTGPPRPGRGRPSLSGAGENSPQIATRVPAQLRDRLQARADAEGKKLSEVVRDALEAYTA